MSFHVTQSIHLSPLDRKPSSSSPYTDHHHQTRIERLESDLRRLEQKDRRWSAEYRVLEKKVGVLEERVRELGAENKRLRGERDEVRRLVVKGEKERERGGEWKGVVYASRREKEERFWVWS